MSKKINLILQQALERVIPPKEDLEEINNSSKEILEKLNKRIKKSGIKAELFVGGSFAKKTLIKKDNYDIDIFIRFNKNYEEQDISKLVGKLLNGIKNLSLARGSRDYFKIKINPNLFIELVPVIKVKKPEESNNITDLSYTHVNYIKKKVKSEKLLNEIKITKAFCYANDCYGAESYISGFSGYAIELLVYHYGSFLKFIKAMMKIKKREIIDIEKHQKNKQTVLMDLNSSKLDSPVILVDPTYGQRNVLAALSEETFKKFQKECSKFIKNPSIKSFELEKINLDKVKLEAKKKKYGFVLLEVKTSKKEEDVAGSKLIKFHRHLIYEIGKLFEIKNKGFEYNKNSSAKCFFVVKNKKEILLAGPKIKDKKNVQAFKKKHKKTFVKNKRIYSKKKLDFNIEGFLKSWKKKNLKKVKEMSIVSLKIN